MELVSIVPNCAAQEKGVLVTHFMYKSFLSYSQLKNLLKKLVATRLLQFDEKSKVYKTTDKGIEFIRLFEKMQDLVGESF